LMTGKGESGIGESLIGRDKQPALSPNARPDESIASPRPTLVSNAKHVMTGIAQLLFEGHRKIFIYLDRDAHLYLLATRGR